MEQLEDKIDRQENYERKDAKIISGISIPVFNTDENCSAVVFSVL